MRRALHPLFADEIRGSYKLFISNVAHELRTPLSVMKTTSEVALLDPDLPRDVRRAFVEIIQELNRSSEIINNLVTLNALQNPERMAVQSLDLAVIVEDMVKKLSSLARERSVKVRVRYTSGALVIGNRSALETVVYNLIKNAIAFTPIDAMGTVVVRIVRENEVVRLVIEDQGIGMSSEELRHIFEPFYRADTSRNRAISQSGSGLGLTIVQEMVHAHGGAITIESKKRAGTTATVTLPRGGFTSDTGREEYTARRPAEISGKDGAHEPHGGRRYFREGVRVKKGIAGA